MTSHQDPIPALSNASALTQPIELWILLHWYHTLLHAKITAVASFGVRNCWSWTSSFFRVTQRSSIMALKCACRALRAVYGWRRACAAPVTARPLVEDPTMQRVARDAQALRHYAARQTLGQHQTDGRLSKFTGTNSHRGHEARSFWSVRSCRDWRRP